MTPYSYISTKVYTKLAPSKVQGVGVFAIKDIEKDTPIFEKWEGKTDIYYLTKEEFNCLDKTLQSHLNDLFSFQLGVPTEKEKFFVHLYNDCHWIYTTPYHFVNSGLEKANIDKTTFRTLRKIYKGEEILSNYGRYDRFPLKQVI